MRGAHHIVKMQKELWVRFYNKHINSRAAFDWGTHYLFRFVPFENV